MVISTLAGAVSDGLRASVPESAAVLDERRCKADASVDAREEAFSAFGGSADDC